MFGYVRRSQVNELVSLYERLLKLDRVKHPITFISLCAAIGDLRTELKTPSKENREG
jgi:hypothetical protein